MSAPLSTQQQVLAQIQLQQELIAGRLVLQINCPLCAYPSITKRTKNNYFSFHCANCHTTIFFIDKDKPYCVHGEFSQTKSRNRLHKRCYLCNNTIFVNKHAFKQFINSDFGRAYMNAHEKPKPEGPRRTATPTKPRLPRKHKPSRYFGS